MLYIPSFKVNLVSILALMKDISCFVVFSSNHFLVQALPSKKVIGKGELHQGLYVLHQSSLYEMSPVVAHLPSVSTLHSVDLSHIVTSVSAHTWH